MARLLLESFGGVTAIADLKGTGNKWDLGAITGTDAGAIDTTTPRTGTQCWKISTSGSNMARSIVSTELFTGLAYNPASVAAGTTDIAVMFGTNNFWVLQRIGSTLNLAYRTGGLTANITTGSVLTAGTYVYIEVHLKISGAGAGVVEIRVNGTVAGSATGITNSGAGSATAYLCLGDRSGSASDSGSFIDDLYVVDTSGSAPMNTYLGDTKIQCLRPNGNGNYSQMVNDAGNSTNNYTHVNEASRSDATYVDSTNNGDVDTYTYDDPSAITGYVVADVAFNVRAAWLASSHTITPRARLSSTDLDGAAITLTNSLADYQQSLARPGGGLWTVADIASAEFGQKQSA